MPDDVPLRVGVPAWTFVPGGMGGMETYARELLRELVTRPDLEVTTLVGAHAAGVLPYDRQVLRTGLSASEATGARLGNVVRALRPDARTRAELDRADVVHHPFTVPFPRASARPRVQTLADLQHRDLPDLFSRAERGYRSMTYDVQARRADVVITISEFSKQRIVEVLGIDPVRVVVAHLGVAAPSGAASGPRDDVVFYPARVWPHKNHARLIEAVARVRTERPGLRLVLTGGGGDALGTLPDWVEERGLVGADELASLYRRAGCLAFPSLYEGFGLPVLEAMAAGCPVAASTAGSLPEIAGDAAVMFDPYDVDAIARAVEGALASRDRLTALGLERAQRFTWSRCAERHVEVYRRLANGPSGGHQAE